MKSAADAVVKRCLHDLREHFDCVQILASVELENEQGTAHHYQGMGNWFARQGMAHDFTERDQADTVAEIIAKAIHPPDDGDEWKGE